MFQTLALLLPGLVPSWKFFKSIEPSPRVQWRLMTDPQNSLGNWQEYRPRPQSLSTVESLKRLIWNPDWNETLYMVSLAERLTLDPTEHSRQEIIQRLTAEIGQIDPSTSHMQFRLLFMHREGVHIVEETTYLSEPHPLGDRAR